LSENSIYPKYYTEKITDCFATGTIPIYYGDRSIGEDFDMNGIIFMDDIDINNLAKNCICQNMNQLLIITNQFAV
jgi:isopentenyl phosphate kinase